MYTHTYVNHAYVFIFQPFTMILDITLAWIKSQLWAVYKSIARAHKINVYKSLSWQ